jgi:FkbM family methyltransferase
MPEIFRHHPLFHTFQPYEGWVEPGFELSYFGANFRDWLFTGESKGFAQRRWESVGYPDVGEEYFEWIALLAAIATANGRFRMFELGAGWGRWSVYAAMLCRQRGLPFRVVAVEPEPSHFERLQMVFRDNGMDRAEHDLREAAVAPDAGPVGLAGIDNPRREYGHYVAAGVGGLVRRLRGGHKLRKVNAVSLASLLEKDPCVDLIDMDIQGMEAKALAAVSAGQLRNVRIIHVGTHSPEVESQIRKRFARMGWLNAFSFSCYSECETPFGTVRFEDGVETWVNPAAAPVLERIQAR